MAVAVLAGGTCVRDSHSHPRVMVPRVFSRELDPGDRILAREFAGFVSFPLLDDGGCRLRSVVWLRAVA